MKKIQLFAALTKIDELKREVWGLATAEVVDKDDQIFDYASSKPYFEDWSREIASATSGKSLGNVREMHQSSAVGKLVDLQFDDEQKTIAVGARIVDDAAWEKCVEGVYTGFSIGGRYVKLWPDGDCVRFTAQPVEISVVDNPAVPNAHFMAIKRDGSVEVRFCHSESAPAEEESLPDRDSRLAIGIPRPPRRTRNDKSKQGEAMKPEQEEKLDMALAQSNSSLEKIQAVDSKLQSLESGLKELADAFRQFTEGFAKSLGESKRVARTSVAVSKEEDGRGKVAGEAAGIHGIRGDADPGFLEAMKAAHANPFRAAGR